MTSVSMPSLVKLTSDITSAYVSANSVEASMLPSLISRVFEALTKVDAAPHDTPVTREPAVPVKKSVFPEYIICLEDGKKLKMLKRHLMSSYSMTPDDYRTRWSLPSSYPMVAPSYATRRSELAKESGLGRKPTVEASTTIATEKVVGKSLKPATSDDKTSAVAEHATPRRNRVAKAA